MKRLVPPDMRCHFTRRGDMKRRYAEQAAKRNAVLFNKEAYQCPMCHFWHLATIKVKVPK